MSTQEALQVLKDNGYYVDNLWSVHDVHSSWNCTDEEAYEVLAYAVDSPYVLENIWVNVSIKATKMGLTPSEID